MMRSIPLVCNICKKAYAADSILYYQEDYKADIPFEQKLICPSCLTAWEKRWQLASAVFYEQDCCLYVDLETTDGEKFGGLDCSVLDDCVVVSVDLPASEKKKLFQWYQDYRFRLDKDKLKTCQFTEAFMKTTFTCETNKGERYEDIVFRISRQGVLETEETIPEEIGRQVLEAWRLYSSTN